MVHQMIFIMVRLWAKVALDLSARSLLASFCCSSTANARSASTFSSDFETAFIADQVLHAA